MTVSVTINGTSYSYPQSGDENWGDQATTWAQAVSQHLLQKTGGAFVLSAEVDFGGSFGLSSQYYKSRTANIATAGNLRLANSDSIQWRNAANSANLGLALASNTLTFNSIALVDISTAQTLTNKTYEAKDNAFYLQHFSAPTTQARFSCASLGVSSTTVFTLPGGGDATLVGEALAQTLTNKTLASPAITTLATFNSQAECRFHDADNSHYVGFRGPDTTTANLSWKLPSADGSSGQVLTTNGAGVLSFGSSAVVPAAGLTYSDGAALQTLAFSGNGNKVAGINSGGTSAELKAFAVGTSGTDFAVAHSAGTITFNLPDASASNRGAVTTGTQTLSGAKTFSSGYNGNTPSAYVFTAWNPSGTGSTTTGPTAGTETLANSDITYSSVSSSTVTVTFVRAGKYLVRVEGTHNHANLYTDARITLTLGGTASRVGNNLDIYSLAPGIVAQASDEVGTVVFIINATASQTLTVKPEYISNGISNTAQHTARCSIVAVPL